MTTLDTAPHILVPPATAEPDLAQIQAAIAAAWGQAQTPPELRAACLEFTTGADTRRHVDHLTAMLMITLGCWIVGGSKAGHDRHVLEQIAAAVAQRCIAMLMRAAKARRGEPYVAARQAIVAFFMADNVANATHFKCDVDAAVAAWEAAMTDDDTEGDAG